MNKIIIFLSVLLLAGCNQYTLVKTEPVKIRGLSITPSLPIWNKLPSVVDTGGAQIWTADGVSLNSISFFSAISDGSTLYRVREKAEYPVYSSDMLPGEIAEFVESSISKYNHAVISNTFDLKPIKIDGQPGFRFIMDFTDQSDVPRRAVTFGAVKDGKLFLVMYQATQRYYYDKYIENVESMMQTAVLN